MKTAYYIVNMKNISFVIPKRRGYGYLKSCFGFHSKNQAAKTFDENRPEWFTNGDCSDIDGYLNIETYLNKWDSGFSAGLIETICALSKAFPHVTEWEWNDEMFWKTVINN